jgi:hypothetical protein
VPKCCVRWRWFTKYVESQFQHYIIYNLGTRRAKIRNANCLSIVGGNIVRGRHFFWPKPIMHPSPLMLMMIILFHVTFICKLVVFVRNDLSHLMRFLPLVNKCVTTLLWENVRMRPTLPKWGLGSPLGLPNFQSSIARVKTPHIGEFFISLENYRSVDVQNGLTWPI